MSQAKNDDFLQQILDAEAQGKKDIEKAKQKNQKDLADHEKKLAQARQEKIEKARSEARDQIKDRQVEARKTYEGLVAEGEREAAKQEKELSALVDKNLPQIQNYFVSELI